MLARNLIPFENYFSCLHYTATNNTFLKINYSILKYVGLFLKFHTNFLFKQLIDVSFIDYFERKYRYEIFYNLLSIQYNLRLIVLSSSEENNIISSFTSLYPNANWYEREAWDMFGIYFSEHPDFRRILTDYGFKGHPLRKDFPMSGYIEVRYDAFLKRILYEGLSLTQEYRIFILDTSWKNI